jgi:hypothetical protein
LVSSGEIPLDVFRGAFQKIQKSIVPPPKRQNFTIKLRPSQDNQVVVFRCGIIDKTMMYEAAWQKCSRDCSLWDIGGSYRHGGSGRLSYPGSHQLGSTMSSPQNHPKRWLHSSVFGLWACSLSYLLFTQRYTAFLRPEFGIIVDSGHVAEFKNDQWVRVEGTFKMTKSGPKWFLVLKRAAITAIDAPKMPYLF